jgi:hypothetical protein
MTQQQRDDTELLEERIEQLEARLRRTERRTAAETAFWALMHNLFPDEARRHLKAAGREQLLAARAYIDHWVKRLDEREQSDAASRSSANGGRHESIEVE